MNLLEPAVATIFAPATGPGRAGIAVIRLSGPAAGRALESVTDRPLPPPRRAVRRRFHDAVGEDVDDGLVLWFPAPASFTGEDVAELHVHGSLAVVSALCEALAAVPGLRPAEPGEFTRRAFDHGKLDLTAAEGLADLIAAETAAQRRQALRQLDGALGRLYEGWRDRLVRVLAHLEAVIDFADEDLPGGIEAAAWPEVVALQAEVRAHLADGHRGERVREGVRIALLGPPNAGKSSLLNALAGRDAAIVHELPGTTRDVIEVALDVAGFPVIVADTAGLRAATGAVEREGVERSRRTAAAADIRVVVLDGALWPAVDPEAAARIDPEAVVVVNKCDLGRVGADAGVQGRPVLPISALTGAGLGDLLAALARRVRDRFDVGAAPSLTRLRHRRALQDCEDALARALATAGAGGGLELAGEDMRLAARALGRITGRVDVEAILDVVFRDFCIGK